MNSYLDVWATHSFQRKETETRSPSPTVTGNDRKTSIEQQLAKVSSGLSKQYASLQYAARQKTCFTRANRNSRDRQRKGAEYIGLLFYFILFIYLFIFMEGNRQQVIYFREAPVNSSLVVNTVSQHVLTVSTEQNNNNNKELIILHIRSGYSSEEL